MGSGVTAEFGAEWYPVSREGAPLLSALSGLTARACLAFRV